MPGIAIEQIVLEVAEKLLGGDALEGEVIEIAAQERIEALAAEFGIEESEEQAAPSRTARSLNAPAGSRSRRSIAST